MPSADVKYARLGRACREALMSRPFGSLSKRELEVELLAALGESGLLPEDPAEIAAALRLSLTKTRAYLTDLALRRPPLEDEEAVRLLADALGRVEVVPSDRHLSIPIANAALRIWLERKLAANGLHPGEGLRGDLVKLTPAGLLRLLDRSVGIRQPWDALTVLSGQFQGLPWFREAKNAWSPRTTWADTLGTLGAGANLAQVLNILLGLP